MSSKGYRETIVGACNNKRHEFFRIENSRLKWVLNELIVEEYVPHDIVKTLRDEASWKIKG